MSKWKCEICNSSFENFDARDFDNKIYCPLCFYKKLYKDTESERERLNNDIKILLKENENKEKVILKYDNIINELEKYCNEEIEDYEKQIKYYKKNKYLRSGILDLVGEYEGEKVCFEDMLGKLHEIKRGNEPSFEEMVGFVENVYKDIKSQPTLHEELEEERKTIAKIVGDFKEVNK